MADDSVDSLQETLGARGIRTMRSAPIRTGYASIAMSTYSVQEFLTALAPGPIGRDDGLAARILGRGQDLEPDDEAWVFEAVPTVRDQESGLELRVVVNIPETDVWEVLHRLGR